MQYLRLPLFTLLFALLASGCASQASDVTLPRNAATLQKVRNSDLQDFVREFGADWGSVASFYELPWSEVRFDRLEALFKSWQTRLNSVDFESLNQQGRIDYLLVRNKLEHELGALALARKRLAEMEELLSFRAPIQKLERTRWRMESVDSQAAASEISALPNKIKKLRERLEKGKKQKEGDKSKSADSDKTKADASAENESGESATTGQKEKAKKDEVL